MGTTRTSASMTLTWATRIRSTAIFARILADGWQPNVVLNNAAITGELLMGAGKPFPDFANTSCQRLGADAAHQPDRRLHDRPPDGPRHRRASGPAR